MANNKFLILLINVKFYIIKEDKVKDNDKIMNLNELRNFV